MSTSDKILVAAIQFGTTHSSYAYSLRSDHKSDPLKVCNSYNWTGSDFREREMSPKTPTWVLFNKDKVFDSFGYEAEDKYSELAEEEEHQEWYFFKNFKMPFFDKNEPLSKAVKIKSTDGKEMVAIDIFSAAIKFLTSHLLNILEKQDTTMSGTDIQWVLTVPAIWDDVAKQFRKEATEKAGICSGQLLIIPEPEAVFVYCMQIKSWIHKNNRSSIGVGTKYMVVIAEDIGVEITVYDVQHKGLLKELYKAYNCDWGGKKVEASFCSLLKDIVGDDVMKAFRCKCEDDFREFLIDFEDGKRKIKPKQTDKFTLQIPCALEGTLTEMNPESDIKAMIASKPKYNKQINVVGDKLRIDAQMAKALFDESCSKIIYHMQELFQYPILKDVSSILLVGSYAMSPMLEFAVREAFKFSHREVIVPQNAEFAVLNGAVIYGHQQTSS